MLMLASCILLDVEEEQDLLFSLVPVIHQGRIWEVGRNVKFAILLCPSDRAEEVLLLHQVLHPQSHTQAVPAVEVVVVAWEHSS